MSTTKRAAQSSRRAWTPADDAALRAWVRARKGLGIGRLSMVTGLDTNEVRAMLGAA